MHPSILLGGSGDPYASVQPLVRRRRAGPPDISAPFAVTSDTFHRHCLFILYSRTDLQL